MLELELPLERQEEGRAAGWRLLSHKPCLQQNKPDDDGDHTIYLGDDCDDVEDDDNMITDIILTPTTSGTDGSV